MTDASSLDSEDGVTPRAYGIMRAVEDAHWWFDAMEAITARLLAAGGSHGGGPRREVRAALDAGCGTGRNLVFLERLYGGEAVVCGVDHSPVALGHCRARGLERLVCASVNRLPFPAESFDLVTSFDVLTAGTVDDAAALAETARVLRPGGRLLARVAAYDFLRSRHDREWNITRRYRRGGLWAALARAGLRVRVSSYANTWLFPVALAKRWAEGFRAPSAGTSDLQIGAGRGPVPWALRTLMTSERRWVAAGALPFGLSLYALAEKP